MLFDRYGSVGVTSITLPMTVLASWEGVTVRRGEHSIWIITEQVFDPDCFDEAIRLLGLQGREDYEIIYHPGTGSETYIFDEWDSQDLQLRPVRDQDRSRVLHGLPEG